MRASAKIKLFFKAVGAVACLGVLGFFLITKSTDIIMSDREVVGSRGSTATGIAGLNNKDETLNILAYIGEGNISEALKLIDIIQNDKELPVKVKQYFDKFKTCYQANNFDTEYFITMEAAMRQHYGEIYTGWQDTLLFTIPYYCIKVQDQNAPDQENKQELYMHYLRTFQNGQTFSIESANVTCLYAYSCYAEACSTNKRDSSFDSYTKALEKIDGLIAGYEEFKNNNTYATQYSYIEESKACLDFKANQSVFGNLKDKHFKKFRNNKGILKPYKI